MAVNDGNAARTRGSADETSETDETQIWHFRHADIITEQYKL